MPALPTVLDWATGHHTAAVTLFPSTQVSHVPYRTHVLIGNMYKLLQCAKFYALLHTSKREVEKMESISSLSDSKY